MGSDPVDSVEGHRLAMVLFDEFWDDSEVLGRDYRGRELVKQMVRSVGSISANIEEGYGRGFGKELAHYLRIARGSARESRGWYQRSAHLLPPEVVQARVKELDHIIGILVRTIRALEQKSQ